MNILLQKATIIGAHSAFHQQIKDILIIDGVITTIADHINEDNAQVIKGNNLHVSIGWLDIFADFAEPGNEHRETLKTGSNAAAAGGFTDVMLVPDTNSVVDSKSQIEFLIQRSKELPVTIHPIGAVSKNLEGNQLSEMYDMHNSGAVAFSDGRKSIQQSGLLVKALQYVAAKNATIIQIPNDKSISCGGLIHKGITSTQLGLPGIPSMAEEIMVARDIALLEYTNSALHFTGISTLASLNLIKEAKKRGLNITCSTTPYHLLFCDEDLKNYDTNLKVNPPLRGRTDMLAMQEALKNGDIDCVASHHNPQTWDDKICEFEYAKNGMITLQTLYSNLNGLLNDTSQIIDILSVKNRTIFDLNIPKIEEGYQASLTIFEPNTEFIFEENLIQSKSKNSAFIGKKLKGKVIGIVHKNNIVLN